MRSVLRGVSALMGVGFTLQGVGWLAAPDQAAATLGMPVLDGLARSTQIGDFAAFFLVLGLSTLAGGAWGRARVLYFPAALLASAAACRTIAWAVHGADFATSFIAVESVASLVLFATAAELRRAV